jgi:hypothetical protein
VQQRQQLVLAADALLRRAQQRRGALLHVHGDGGAPSEQRIMEADSVLGFWRSLVFVFIASPCESGVITSWAVASVSPTGRSFRPSKGTPRRKKSPATTTLRRSLLVRTRQGQNPRKYPLHGGGGGRRLPPDKDELPPATPQRVIWIAGATPTVPPRNSPPSRYALGYSPRHALRGETWT